MGGLFLAFLAAWMCMSFRTPVCLNEQNSGGEGRQLHPKPNVATVPYICMLG